jgi:hypothetical protein
MLAGRCQARTVRGEAAMRLRSARSHCVRALIALSSICAQGGPQRECMSNRLLPLTHVSAPSAPAAAVLTAHVGNDAGLLVECGIRSFVISLEVFRLEGELVRPAWVHQYLQPHQSKPTVSGSAGTYSASACPHSSR